MPRVNLPIGTSDFAEIRREGWYYVDKTGLIGDLLNASLESPVGEEEDSSLGDFVADENAEAPGKAADRAMVAQQINQALKSLTPREEKVIRLRFGLDDGRPRTLEEVGRDFGVTRERVRQIEAKAIRKLHSRKCLALLNGLIE